MATTTDSFSTILDVIRSDTGFDPAEAAAAGFLARYSGHTRDAYRHDLRTFFQWADDVGLLVLSATRAHVELYRTELKGHGLAPATVDRRLCTVCRLLPVRPHRRPHQLQPRPVRPPPNRAPDRGARPRPGRARPVPVPAERIDPDHAALAVLLGLNGLRVSEACATNIKTSASTRSPHPAHHRQGQQAGSHPASPAGRTDH